MILDRLENAYLYENVNPNLACVLQFLQEHKEELQNMESGPIKLTDYAKGKTIEYQTVVGSRKWESHLEFTDVQYMISGTERVGFNHPERMVNPKKQDGKDQIYYDGAGDPILLPEGYFIILFPGEVHMSKLADGVSTTVKKAAFKVRL